MIDNQDSSSSVLRLLVSQALKDWKIAGVQKLLTEEDVIVRTAAARELHSRGEKETYDYVEKLAHDDQAFVREIAAFTLGQLGTPLYPYRKESLPILCDLLGDQAAETRAAAAAALGHMCYDKMPRDIESALIACVIDVSSDVRSCVGYALGNSSGSVQARDALAKLENDENENVRSYAKLGLELLQERGMIRE
jgi:HEAT repeat protein